MADRKHAKISEMPAAHRILGASSTQGISIQNQDSIRTIPFIKTRLPKVFPVYSPFSQESPPTTFIAAPALMD